MPGWIGVDLDGTLAEYRGFIAPDIIGAPIPDYEADGVTPTIMWRVKKMIRDGVDVRIFTARVYSDGTPQRDADRDIARMAIDGWCHAHLGKSLPITCVKDYGMDILYDDRAVQVERNTGRILGDEAGALENIKKK